MIQLNRITRSFRKSGKPVPVLSEVSLDIRDGAWLTITGPSGAGKSTLLYTIAGLLKPDTGRVLVNGHDIYALSGNRRAALRGSGMGFIFQSFHLFPHLTVLGNVLTAGGRFGRDRDSARTLLDRMGLSARENHLPSELSVGEKQRVAVARAVFKRPSVILADEPTGNLDPENGARVITDLATFNRDGITVLFVTHKPLSEINVPGASAVRVQNGAVTPL